MMASGNQVFESDRTLNATNLGNDNLILGMPWLKCHLGWVGAAGPSLLLVNPVFSTDSVSSGQKSSAFLDSPMVPNTSPSSTLPSHFSHFSDVFLPPSSSPLPWF